VSVQVTRPTAGAGPAGQVVRLPLVVGGASADAEAFDRLVPALQSFAAGEDSAAVIVVESPIEDGGERAALRGVLRGSMQASALELAESGKRVNGILVDAGTDAEDLEALVNYLIADEAASTTGTTHDLRRRISGERPATPGRTVALVGAAGTIGSAVAQVLDAAGHHLVLVDKAADRLSDLAGSLTSAVEVVSDLLDPDAADRLADQAAELKVDAVVLLQGVPAGASLPDISGAKAKIQYAINATSAIKLVDRLAPVVAESGRGVIVATSSQAGLIGEKANTSYCAGKFALADFVYARIGDLAAQGVATHLLCPGPVDGPLMRASFADMGRSLGITAEEYFARRMSTIPLGRPALAEEIGAAVRTLLALRSTTGLTFAPTGGAVMN